MSNTPSQTTRKSPERITAAAIWAKGSDIPWSLPPPKRHHDIIRLLAANGFGPDKVGPTTQGFMTSAGRYVDRVEGRQIAEAAGQMLRKNAGGNQLYSEDMW